MPNNISIHDGYSVEPLTRGLFGELKPLMLDAFGDSVSTEYFDWKYLNNPAGEAIGHVARAGDGTIAAFYGMIPEGYRFGSTVRRLYQSCDTMTHSSHRRKGLFQSLALMTYRDGLEADEAFLAFGFGGPTSTPGFLKMGWRVEFEIPYLFQPFPLTSLAALGARADAVERLDGPTDALVDLVMRSARDRSGGVDRSDRFVRWRLANPQRRYSYFRDGDRAYSIHYRANDFLFLFDFWESETGAGRRVLSALRRESLELHSKGILTMCQQGTPMARRLRRHGFLRNPFPRGPASGRIPFITFNAGSLQATDWSISPFDHDSY